ncbi:MAG TPA: hypothetical protein VKR79_03905 [Gaiellaceae bacterium]|nr:hypothetical protein [Gaiellaceae bacterium]
MKRLGVVIAVGLALLPAAAAGSVAKEPHTATAAFGALLRQLYGNVHGYWTCPAAQSFDGNSDCLGEVEAGGEWHQFSARAHRYHGIFDFHLPQAVTWTRHWSQFSRHYILRSGEDAPGVVSVNSPAYDWGWLANCAAQVGGGTRAGHPRVCGAFDGNSAGLSRFYSFTCARSGGLITCRNALGDAMRYRPHG